MGYPPLLRIEIRRVFWDLSQVQRHLNPSTPSSLELPKEPVGFLKTAVDMQKSPTEKMQSGIDGNISLYIMMCVFILIAVIIYWRVKAFFDK
jgi:hypothetical protein